MTTCQAKIKAKSGDTAHKAETGGAPHARGVSPTSNGPLNSFYSFGPIISLGTPIQRKLTVNQPNDRYEREADRVADQVMRMPEPQGELVQRQSGCPECMEQEVIQTKPLTEQITPLVQRQEEEEEEEPIQAKHLPGKSSPVTAGLQSRIQSIRGGGQPLPQSSRSYFEPRFGTDFSLVRVHTNSQAAETAQSINAKAFTTGRNVVFGAGQYSPETSSGKRLLAHELTHIVQQCHGELSHLPSVQRVVELRPPGRGEASAFERSQELIDRLNAQNPAIQYKLDGRVLRYKVLDKTALTNFDTRMLGFIKREEVVPMRLITSAGLVRGGGGNYEPLLIDSFIAAYVDLDDLLASDDLSFQLNLIHILVERFKVKDYERLIGTNIPRATFRRAHRAACEAEAEHLQSVIGDPTISFNYEEIRPNGTAVFAFRSQEGYRVFHVFRRSGRQERRGEFFVQTRDRRRLTIEELMAERAAAAAP